MGHHKSAMQHVSGILVDTDSHSDHHCEDAVLCDRLMAKLNNYKFLKCEQITTDPLQFWKLKESVFPNVALQAQKLLSMPATSLPSDRVFSAAELLVDKCLLFTFFTLLN